MTAAEGGKGPEALQRQDSDMYSVTVRDTSDTVGKGPEALQRQDSDRDRPHGLMVETEKHQDADSKEAADRGKDQGVDAGPPECGATGPVCAGVSVCVCVCAYISICTSIYVRIYTQASARSMGRTVQTRGVDAASAWGWRWGPGVLRVCRRCLIRC